MAGVQHHDLQAGDARKQFAGGLAALDHALLGAGHMQGDALARFAEGQPGGLAREERRGVLDDTGTAQGIGHRFVAAARQGEHLAVAGEGIPVARRQRAGGSGVARMGMQRAAAALAARHFGIEPERGAQVGDGVAQSGFVRTRDASGKQRHPGHA